MNGNEQRLLKRSRSNNNPKTSRFIPLSSNMHSDIITPLETPEIDARLIAARISHSTILYAMFCSYLICSSHR